MERITFNQTVLETINELQEIYKMYGNGREHPTSPLEHAILMCHTELGNFFRQKELIERVQIDNNGGKVYEEEIPPDLKTKQLLDKIIYAYEKAKENENFSECDYEWVFGEKVAELLMPRYFDFINKRCGGMPIIIKHYIGRESFGLRHKSEHIIDDESEDKQNERNDF